jgi:methionine sulfoxide reductase catalytic subunit
LKNILKRTSTFGILLIRLHHSNAILFFLLSLTGLLLFSSSFRSTFPSIRVWMKDFHILIGVISCLPLIIYFPMMKKHVKTLRTKKNHLINLKLVLTVLAILVISGISLSIHRQLPPIISSWALLLHDVATWVGLPYVIYHSITRSKWFKRLEKRYIKVDRKEEPKLIEKGNPIYNRRTLLRKLTGSLIALIFLPAISEWLGIHFNLLKDKTLASKSPSFSPLPTPHIDSAPPIGGGRKGEFRHYTITKVPKLNDENWSFTIDGLVEKQSTYQWNQFIELQRKVQVSDFHCVTGWSVFAITWEGIPLRTFLEQAGVKKEAKFVKFYSADGVYTDTLPINQAMAYDIMVALLIDGELIPEENGGPVRLVVPKMYAYKSVKWLSRIELIDQEHIGYWEERGYPQEAWVGIGGMN